MMDDRVIKTTTRGDGEVQVCTMTSSCCAPYITHLIWTGKRFDDWPLHLSAINAFTEAEALRDHAKMVNELDAWLARLVTEAA